MARSRSVEAPARNDIYFGMWLVTLIATATAVVLLCLEMTEYGWTSAPVAASALPLPNVPVRTPAPAGGSAMAEPVAQPKSTSPVVQVPTAPINPPSVSHPVPPSPIPSSLLTKTPEPKTATQPDMPAKTVDALKPVLPAGPAPGGFELPKRN